MVNKGQQAPVLGCLMCDSLYVKANGELPCWDDVGEDLVLRTIDEQILLADGKETIFDSAGLVRIRKSFLEGRDPHPDLCSKCAVRGHGTVTSLHPKAIRVLHIEPAYLCQLACPQCIAPRLRLQLKKPPYYMSLSFYEALLRRLREEQVHTIRLVHFEGRGDPLLNKDLGEMVRCTREIYPDAFIKATSHGNYPFASWMLESGLDLLRLSVDGAFEDSYARYRVGGKLQKALDLMRSIRDKKPGTMSRLRVEWKYILFEWNDSDEEIREASRLADELEADLRFCLTHTPGRSQRFHDLDDLRSVLARCAPRATRSLTFQLKPGPNDAGVRNVVAEHAEALLLSALRDYRGGRSQAARSCLIVALTFDPGLNPAELELCGRNPAKEHLRQILSSATAPSTLSALANIQLVLEEGAVAEQLFRGYLSLAPDAPDRARVEQLLAEIRHRDVEASLLSSIEHYESGENQAARACLIEALALDPGLSPAKLERCGQNPAKEHLRQILSSATAPSTLSALANIQLVLEEGAVAEQLFRGYLSLAPDAPDRARVERVLLDLTPQNEKPKVLAYLDAIRRGRGLRPIRRSWGYFVQRVGRFAGKASVVAQGVFGKPTNRPAGRRAD